MSSTDAYNVMVDHAFAMGATAVLGVRYDATDIAEGITESALRLWLYRKSGRVSYPRTTI